MRFSSQSRTGCTANTSQNWRRKMAKARNFSELEAKMSPERRAAVAARVKETLENMSLDQLRAARELTQEHLAEILRIKQAGVSKMERRTDMDRKSVVQGTSVGL